jgi:hypothetical protein
MSTRGTYLDGDRVFLDDAHGHHTHFPARVAHLLLTTAKNDDNGIARWALRPFDRDVLQGAVDLLDQRDQCTQPPCEDAAVFDLADARPRCDSHHQDA